MKCFWVNEFGQGVVEYGLIIALVVTVIVVGLRLLGGTTNLLFTDAIENWPS